MAGIVKFYIASVVIAKVGGFAECHVSPAFLSVDVMDFEEQPAEAVFSDPASLEWMKRQCKSLFLQHHPDFQVRSFAKHIKGDSFDIRLFYSTDPKSAYALAQRVRDEIIVSWN